jgi:hypothetical protein
MEQRVSPPWRVTLANLLRQAEALVRTGNHHGVAPWNQA